MNKTVIIDEKFSHLSEKLWKEKGIDIWKVKKDLFKDNWPNFLLEETEKYIEHKDVTYIWDFSDRKTMFDHLSILSTIVSNNADKLRIIMPFFPCGTMEKEDVRWRVITAKIFADLISSIPPGRDKKNSIHIFDIHDLWTRNYFNLDRINPELHTTMHLIKEEIEQNVQIAFPDEWAYKRFNPQFKDFEKIVCEKRRLEWDKRKIWIKEWNPKWKDILIIDDLIQTGWTVIEAVNKLRENWAKSVRVYIPHWVFPENSHKKVAQEVDELIVSDSIPTNIEKAKDTPNMKVLEMSDLIRNIILYE